MKIDKETEKRIWAAAFSQIAISKICDMSGCYYIYPDGTRRAKEKADAVVKAYRKLKEVDSTDYY